MVDNTIITFLIFIVTKMLFIIKSTVISGNVEHVKIME